MKLEANHSYSAVWSAGVGAARSGSGSGPGGDDAAGEVGDGRHRCGCCAGELGRGQEGGRAVAGGGRPQDTARVCRYGPKTWSDSTTTRPSTFPTRIPHRLQLPCTASFLPDSDRRRRRRFSISTVGDVPSDSSQEGTQIRQIHHSSAVCCQHLDLFTCYSAADSMQLWSRPAVTHTIVLNEQAIVNNLTEDNLTSIFASRRTWEDEQVYLVHDQGIAGIGPPPPYTLVVKKFQNKNPALQLEESVKNRCKSELNLLANICHDNIINVVDLIQREDAIMLVYEYPVNGSLQSWLHQPMDAGQPLSWPKRNIIAIGVAQGLCHLHHGCNKPVVHHSICPNNILLDQTFKAVIAGFDAAQINMAGLDQPLPITDLPPGNFGYAAPEYGNTASPMTEKVDTYSFGVLLLVLVTGREANGAGADGHLAVWARNFTELMADQPENFEDAVDMVIPDQARYMEEMATVFRLGVDCTAVDPKQRPTMRMALKRLRRGCRSGSFRGLLTCYLP